MKCIRKFTPVSPYDIQGLESWLEDQSLRGLLFRSRISHLTCFQAGPPAPYRRFRQEVIRYAPQSPLLAL